ncbi:uncharacterized protein LOC102809720 [Saccoglossus kowalevskii]|uniref:Uncharacterized protein LOC102809720 n=1 Tax=Saccoglossus kowalevskii TaxID=10224 RepID=A0ABM0M9T1_SACKO|nr:PREDICTED: uncharacterized protein LOC102809720 [Saccoglossus kowalevskii]
MRSVQQQCTSSLQTRFNDVLDIDGYVTAALGDSWTHSVNTRLVLQYVDQQQRQIVIAKSPIAQVASVNYVIEDKGPTEVSDSLIVYDSRSMPLWTQLKYNMMPMVTKYHMKYYRKYN